MIMGFMLQRFIYFISMEQIYSFSIRIYCDRKEFNCLCSMIVYEDDIYEAAMLI